MESTPRLSETLVDVLPQHHTGRDLRHLTTLAWMTVGLSQSGTISLPAWVPSVHRRAVYAQSTVRRFARWLEHDRLDGHALYGPLRHHALAAWDTPVLSLALETAMLWDPDGLVRIALGERGRAIPIVWTVLAHARSRIAYEV
jgi:hypothetical protein